MVASFVPGTPRIQVTHLLGSANPGGVESFVLGLARDLDRQRFDLSVLITDEDGPVTTELRDRGVDVVLLGRAPATPGDWWSYARAIRARRGAILHANLGGRALRLVGRVAGHGPSIVHIHGPADDLVPTMRRDPSSLHDAIQRQTSGADRVLACSESLAAVLRTALPAIAGRLDVVHNGVDVAEFAGPSVAQAARSLRAQLAIPDGALVVGFVGRLAAQKGIDHLASIARRVLVERPPVHLIVAGDGPLLSLVRAVGNEFPARVHALGWRRDVPVIVNAADLILVPSQWEPFGIVCIEAMAASRPVAAFAVDGIPESVIDGETGLLAPAWDERALADRVLNLLDDAELRVRLGRAGRARVEQHFQSRFTARRLEEIYTALAWGSRRAT